MQKPQKWRTLVAYMVKIFQYLIVSSAWGLCRMHPGLGGEHIVPPSPTVKETATDICLSHVYSNMQHLLFRRHLCGTTALLRPCQEEWRGGELWDPSWEFENAPCQRFLSA